MEVNEALENLGSGNRDERVGAANALGNAAQGGEDISAAIGALESALSDPDPIVRVRAAWALAIHYFQKGDLDSVNKLRGNADKEVRNGTVQAFGFAMREGIDLAPLMMALEKDLAEAADSSLKFELAGILAIIYLKNGLAEKAAGLLKHEDTRIRSRAASSYMSAEMGGADISPLLAPLEEALGDKEQDVRHYAAEALVGFHAKRKQWKDIDALLANKRSDVRYTAITDLQSHAGSFDIRSDIPNLLKSLEDSDFEVRKGAVTILGMAAKAGQDISFSVTALKRAAAYGDDDVKEAVGNALKEYELRKEPGARCKHCLDCETGLGPGDESKAFEDLGMVVKEIACCGGEVAHRIFRCRQCGKHYLSSYYDHTGFEAEQFSIAMIDEADSDSLAKEFGKCPSPGKRDCRCEVHTVFLKHDAVPVKGVVKYKATMD